jgi:hypothetical protein
VIDRIAVQNGGGFQPPVFVQFLVENGGANFEIPLVGFTSGNRIAIQFSASVKVWDREVFSLSAVLFRISLVTTSGTTIFGVTGGTYFGAVANAGVPFVWLSDPLIAEASMVVNVEWSADPNNGSAVSPFPSDVFDAGVGHLIEDANDPPTHASMVVWEIPS